MEKVEASMQFDKEPMHSNHQTVSHSPEIFTMDFKSIYPQFTPDNKAILNVSHKVILMEPHVAKSFLQVLQENVQNYEEQYGEITVPAAVQKARDEAKEVNAHSTPEKPMYMG